MKKVCNLIILILFLSIWSFSETIENKSSLFSLTINPGISIPLGESGDYFKLGGQVKLSGEYKLQNIPIIFLGGEIGYKFHPIKAEESISILSLGAGGGVRFPITNRFNVKVN